MRGNPILSSERMLDEDYNLKGSVAEFKSLLVTLKGSEGRTK
jgi:hypothetical protein